ncbi:site-specific DNA-methyltransferase [Acidobacteriia bacterium AH_259_A11_L15]|nr:site-specific DNA-methyltransferase [Acidobacteriia bacterium AH_259_A11_L15]
MIEYTSDQLRKRGKGNGGIWRLPHNYDGNQRSPLPRFTVLRARHFEQIRNFHKRLAPLLFRLLVPGGHVIIASQNLVSHLVVKEFRSVGFEMRGQIARVVRTLRGGDRPKGAHKKYPGISVTPRGCWEPWLIFRKPCDGRVRDNLRKWKTGALRRPAPDLPFADLIPSRPAKRIEREMARHPSLKPQELMRQLVWAALPLGKGTVLDPFMGSGATVAAAEYHGFKSIGLELDKQFFQLARRAIPKLARLRLNDEK